MPRLGDDDAPWLAEGVREAPATFVPRARLFGGALLVLAVAVLVALGVYFASRHKSDGSGGYARAEDAPLIAADPGPDKVPPTNPGGAQITGIDDSVATVASGADTGSAIVDDAPEEPLARPGTSAASASTPPPTELLPATTPPARVVPVVPFVPPVDGPIMPAPTRGARDAPPAAKPTTSSASATLKPIATSTPPAGDKPAATAAPASSIKPAKPAKHDPLADVSDAITTATAPAAKSGGGTVTLQLGAFSTRDKAEAAWTKAAAGGALTGLAKRVEPVDRDGATLYRLRAGGVASKDAAKTLCGRIAATGTACIVAQ